MPRLKHSVPKYRRHKASGQAVVTLRGKDNYLGPYGSKASRVEYDRLIGEWLAGHRAPTGQGGIAVVELCTAYWRFARKYYGPDSGSIHRIKIALKVLKTAYSRVPVGEFGPLSLQAIQCQLADSCHSRRYVNNLVQSIRRIFKWGVSQELVPVDAYQSLATVSGLQAGRSAAREPEPVKPVAEPVIDTTRLHLPKVVADMIDVQRLCGCRPGELVIMRPMDIDRRADVWEYRPVRHKGQWREKERIIFLGPRCQELLTPYLLRPDDAHLFVPKRKRKTGEPYTVGSYRAAIKTAAEKAGVPRWTPLQLRHTAGTNVRREYGLEAAQSTLGHSHASVTEIYAEKNQELARDVARKIG